MDGTQAHRHVAHARAVAKGLYLSGSRVEYWCVCAEPGKTASDIGQGSGPYAAALATELVKPGQSDLIMFHNVRVAVMDKTKGDQVSWTEDGIQRRQRVLFGGEAKAPPSSQAGPMRLSEADKPARKNEAPTVSGMLRCESYPERTACELNTSSSWAANTKCQQKSGGLATALLEALPPSKPAPERVLRRS